ncbi:MAG: DUF4239 domain-containing protein [Candidatus Margulisbacteria bacterium]|nr:DUF4239 domain-containing protein [Candidatus Margulisiibacteriota bacterium]
MTLIQLLLYKVPSFFLAVCIVAIAVLFSIGGLFLVRSVMPIPKRKLHNDVAGPLFATVGVIYAVLLAFMVVIAWENFHAASNDVAKEANYIADIYRDTAPLSPAFRDSVKTALKEYVSDIVHDEWPLLAKGKRSEKVQAVQGRLWNLFSGYQPRTETEKIFFTEAVKKFNEACELRRLRLLDARASIHPVLWFVLIAGGLITISFIFFFGTENFGPHLWMGMLLAALIALALFTIMTLDYPFTGDVSIKPDTFRVILQTLISGK